MAGTHLNISIVSSENFACSTVEPTMRISCRLSVMCGVRSHGGVVNGLSLEPEPLTVKRVELAYSKSYTIWPVLSLEMVGELHSFKL